MGLEGIGVQKDWLAVRERADAGMAEDEESAFRAAVMASALMRIEPRAREKAPDTMSSIWGPGGIECGREALSRNVIVSSNS